MTLEELARQAAEALVVVDYHEREPGFQGWFVAIRGVYQSSHLGHAVAEGLAASFREAVGAAVLQALRRAAVLPPVDSGLSAERLAEMQAEDGRWSAPPVDAAAGHRRMLLAHVAFLTRLLHDCAADGTAQVWQAGREAGRVEGFREGAEAQRDAATDAVRKRLAAMDVGLDASTLPCEDADCRRETCRWVRCVLDAPLVTDTDSPHTV